jgi:hypothetical protein
MVIKCTKLYEPEAYSSVSVLAAFKVFLRNDAMTLTFEKQLGSISYQVYQVVWSSSLIQSLSYQQCFSTKWYYDFDLEQDVFVKHKCPCTRLIPKAAIMIKTPDKSQDVNI